MLPLPDGTSGAAARTAGAARATGRWLHFVSAKDGLPPGSTRTVAERLTELPDTVDVLLLDHLRSTWRGTGPPSADGPCSPARAAPNSPSPTAPTCCA
ncbi:hypothetical protein SHKM778_84470 [Streptomyces sp. KM77-8]|uniref:Uncharacterized protein n=1 Tax=Streptomyces haneummycinicus TaxID=3074435 RepID=A0AAT9HWP4_9ACTN